MVFFVSCRESAARLCPLRPQASPLCNALRLRVMVASSSEPGRARLHLFTCLKATEFLVPLNVFSTYAKRFSLEYKPQQKEHVLGGEKTFEQKQHWGKTGEEGGGGGGGMLLGCHGNHRIGRAEPIWF